ncbi:MAG: glycine zipper family protein [Pseudomonadota bacterium]
MKNSSKLILALMSVSLFAGPSQASDFFIYPTKGQNKDQQSKDEYECHSWSVGQTGFDPTKPYQTSSPPPQQRAKEGGLLGGAARGAALGAVGGAIAGDAGKGAAIGAATGGLFGGMRRRSSERTHAQAQHNRESQHKAELQQKRSTYNRAYTACLEGRGYTVK